MSILQLMTLGVTHPSELRSLLAYKAHLGASLSQLKASPDAGWERATMRECWGYLDLTSRSFAAVVKELKGEMVRVVCLFYLALRALDTIEDDMTIPQHDKVPLLLDFYKKLDQPGWNFNESECMRCWRWGYGWRVVFARAAMLTRPSQVDLMRRIALFSLALTR